MSVNVLDRETFTEAEAARMLRVAQRTLNYWLEGGEYRGRVYRPVIRVEPRGGHAAVTWAEFVEAGLRPQACNPARHLGRSSASHFRVGARTLLPVRAGEARGSGRQADSAAGDAMTKPDVTRRLIG